MPGLNSAQQEVMAAFRSREFKYYCLAGSTGSGKTFFALALLNLLCMNIGGLKFGVFRKTETNLKQTTIPSFEEMKRKTGTVLSSQMNGMTAQYSTGSEILFTWADISKDSELNKVRGLELTAALLEEGNEIDKKYFSILKTRIGRWNNSKCPPFILITLNPSYGWVREMFYDPWTKDELTKPYFFKEFEVGDNKTNLEPEYIEVLEDLPEEEYNRFVLNNWDFIDNPAQLIQYDWLKNVLIPEDEEIEIPLNARHQIICDPADQGTDRHVKANAFDSTLYKWQEWRKQDAVLTGEYILKDAYELRSKRMMIDERDIVIDGIGVGVGTVGACKRGLIMREGERPFKINPFIFKSNLPAKNDGRYFEGFYEFESARDEGGWMVREAIKNAEVRIRNREGLAKELLGIEYDTDNRKLFLLPKKKIKKNLGGLSPDYFDTILMWIWNLLTNAPGQSTEIMAIMNANIKKLNLRGRE